MGLYLNVGIPHQLEILGSFAVQLSDNNNHKNGQSTFSDGK